MKSKTRQVILGMVLLLATGTLGHAEPNGPAKPTRVCAVCQSWGSKDRNVAHVLEILDQAAAQGAEVVCLPQDCVPSAGGPSARAALEVIAKAAAERKMYVAANLNGQFGMLIPEEVEP